MCNPGDKIGSLQQILEATGIFQQLFNLDDDFGTIRAPWNFHGALSPTRKNKNGTNGTPLKALFRVPFFIKNRHFYKFNHF